MNQEFTHFDKKGNAIMVDISPKNTTERSAVAKGAISIGKDTLKAIQENKTHKGDVLGVARIAGIIAIKKTAELIPLCHPLLFNSCAIDFEIQETQNNPKIVATCTVKLSGKTGAEMEALTGVSIALLTIYDMCKALDKNMYIDKIYLHEKTGGKS